MIKSAVDNARDSCFLVDGQGRIVYANNAACKSLGYSREQMFDMTFFDIDPGFPPEMLGRRMSELIEKTTDIFDSYHMTRDGHIFPVELSVNCLSEGREDFLSCVFARNISKRKATEEAIDAYKISLEHKVAEKEKAMKELAQSQSSLIKASRAAGMAEVATNVLHNVGNVLNSINTSVTVLEERLKKSRMTNVQKVVDMLPRSQKKLAAFFSQDPKGTQVLDYLTSLSWALRTEWQEMQNEIKTLAHQVDHVKNVIVMQQRYGSAYGVKESFTVEPLIEDAIAMNRADLKRNSIKVERRFDVVPKIVRDKHQVLQILVNLIANAINGCSENKTGQGDSLIIIRLYREGENRIKIQVEDNGVGIAPENLSRIFHHGFTTRRGGHGFGLHSGALTAKQLGGSLSAESAGLGFGAVFTLTLPLSIQETS